MTLPNMYRSTDIVELPSSQLLPVVPLGHLQTYPSPVSWHRPPLQGLLSHAPDARKEFNNY